MRLGFLSVLREVTLGALGLPLGRKLCTPPDSRRHPNARTACVPTEPSAIATVTVTAAAREHDHEHHHEALGLLTLADVHFGRARAVLSYSLSMLLLESCVELPTVPECRVECDSKLDCPSGTTCHRDGYCHGTREETCLEGYRQVAAGRSLTCGIRTSGELWCWGHWDRWQAEDTEKERRSVPIRVGGTAKWLSVDAGWRSACAIRDDSTLWCWGEDEAAEIVRGNGDMVEVLPGRAFKFVSVGGNHACAIDVEGQAWCWGRNNSGQLGLGLETSDADPPVSPQKVGDANDWTSISAGDGCNYENNCSSDSHHTCGIRGRSTLWCWGVFSHGEETKTHVHGEPQQVDADTDWVDVQAGHDMRCALRADGSVWCWGSFGRDRDRDVGSTDVARVPILVESSVAFEALSLSSKHACAIARIDHSLWCWGDNRKGQLGDGSSLQRKEATQIGVDKDWSSVAAGTWHACGLRKDGTLWCWGSNNDGQLGIESETRKTVPGPNPADALGDWRFLAAGWGHGCGIRADNTLWCWGDNSEGALGDGTMRARASPVQVGGEKDWQQACAGTRHTCGIRQDGSLWCWGGNSNGQLGHGALNAAVAEPARVGDSAWKSVSCGGAHTCGIQADGTLLCWGGKLGIKPRPRDESKAWTAVSARSTRAAALRGQGELWDTGGDPQELLFRPIAALAPTAPTDWVSVAQGDERGCALRKNGQLGCWAYSGSDPDGLENWFQKISDASWNALAASPTHACGLQGTKLLCWGNGTEGELGVGHLTVNWTIGGGVDGGVDGEWDSASPGSGFTCALSGGQRWCWGNNALGQLGNGEGALSVPLMVSRRPHQ
ncbi:MAG: hypothetical protein HY698_13115 [Deltaproteobacteria bacterium]|nr:hypothetical protein [Deltaproteobacteria bacterium]